MVERMNAENIIYAVREGLKEYTDDTRYTDDYIMYLVKNKRSFLIRREYSNLQRTIDQELIQTLCVGLEIVDDSDCPECIDYTSDCTILRTKQPVPFTIELHNRNSITRIAFTKKTGRKINFVSKERFVYSGEGDYEKREIFAYLDNDGHIYLKSKSSGYASQDILSVSGLFDNPDDLTEFECSGQECYSNISRYPIKGWMEEIIIKEIISELANLKQLPTDEVNNARDDNG